MIWCNIGIVLISHIFLLVTNYEVHFIMLLVCSRSNYKEYGPQAYYI